MSYFLRPRTPTLRPQTPPPRPQTLIDPQFYLNSRLPSYYDSLNEELERTKGNIESNAEHLADTQKEIICIKCSIKKLELDMKLTKEDSIEDDEFISLINEIKSLCIECGCTEDEINKFTQDAIMKRCMNKVGAFIKVVAFIFPTLSNLNLFLIKQFKKNSNLSIVVSHSHIEKAQQMCCFIVTYLYGAGITGRKTAKLLNDFNEGVDYVGKLQDANIIEYLVNPSRYGFLEPIIVPVNEIIYGVMSSTSPEIFEKLSSYQKLILIIFISYLSVNILLNMAMYGDKYTENLYGTIYANFRNTTDNFRLTNGGKRSRQKKQQSSKKTTKAAKAAKAAKEAKAAKAVKILKLKKPKLKRKN